MLSGACAGRAESEPAIGNPKAGDDAAVARVVVLPTGSSFSTAFAASASSSTRRCRSRASVACSSSATAGPGSLSLSSGYQILPRRT